MPKTHTKVISPFNLKTAINPRKTRKVRNKTIDCIDSAIHPLGNELQLGISLNILRAFALRRNTCLPHFVLLVFFVDQLLYLGLMSGWRKTPPAYCFRCLAGLFCTKVFRAVRGAVPPAPPALVLGRRRRGKPPEDEGRVGDVAGGKAADNKVRQSVSSRRLDGIDTAAAEGSLRSNGAPAGVPRAGAPLHPENLICRLADERTA